RSPLPTVRAPSTWASGSSWSKGGCRDGVGAQAKPEIVTAAGDDAPAAAGDQAPAALAARAGGSDPHGDGAEPAPGRAAGRRRGGAGRGACRNGLHAQREHRGERAASAGPRGG